MSSQVLDPEVRLLVAQHGHRKVLEALATAHQCPLDEIERQIRAIEDRGGRQRTAGRKKTPSDLIQDLTESAPEKRPVLLEMAAMFDAKHYLPERQGGRRIPSSEGRQPEDMEVAKRHSRKS